MTFSGILSGIGKILKYVVISIVLYYGIAFAINIVDEDLTPEAKALLTVPHTKSDPGNGYLALVGMTAPPTEDIVAYGTLWVDTYNAATDEAALEKANATFNGSKLVFRGDGKLLCNPAKAPCIPLARENADLWHKFATDNEMLMTRQRRLTGFVHFEENYFAPIVESTFAEFTSKSPFPHFNALQSPHLLELDLIALDVAEGRLGPALAALEARIAFDRRVLLGARYRITGMMAERWLEQDLALLAEIVATRSMTLAAYKARLERMTEPLDIHQIRTIAGKQAEGEYRSMCRSMPETLNEVTLTMFRPFGKLFLPFAKLQASQNMIAHTNSAFQARLADFSTGDSGAWIGKGEQAAKNERDAADRPWRLYNSNMRGVLSYEIGNFDSNLLQLSDLMGITRLARLQVDVVTAGMAGTGISAQISADKALYDPYTGKPMGWDAGKQQLHFETRGTRFGLPKRIQVGI